MASRLPQRTVYGTWILLGILLATLTGLFSPAPRPVQAQTTCGGTFTSISPALTDLGGSEYVRLADGPTGHTGGLYPGGVNSRPAATEAEALSRASQIIPLDSSGNPDPINGSIAMISVGMSNTQGEFQTFIQEVNNASNINPRLKLINGALSGMTSDRWVSPTAPVWDHVDSQLAGEGLTPAQVQIAWVKQARAGNGDFPEKAQALQADLEAIARNLLTRYPNIQIAYFSSRTRSYLYWNGLSPEPIAFETGFAVRWMIEKQINGDPTLNHDPATGPVVAPLLVWGPYLWADGTNPRSDGFVWLPEDLAEDCTHPSPNGRLKVANLLLEFFQSDSSTSPWFLVGSGVTPTPPAPTATPTGTPFPAVTPQAYLPVVQDEVQYNPLPNPSSPNSATGEHIPMYLENDLQVAGAVTLLLLLFGLGVGGWWVKHR